MKKNILKKTIAGIMASAIILSMNAVNSISLSAEGLQQNEEIPVYNDVEEATGTDSFSDENSDYETNDNDEENLMDGSYRYVYFGKYQQSYIEDGEIHRRFRYHDIREGFFSEDGYSYYGKDYGLGENIYVVEPIKWVVLKEDGSSLTLMSEKSLSNEYFSWDEMTGWRDSGCRKWLNEDFCNAAFSKEERNDILETENIVPQFTYKEGLKYDREDIVVKDKVYLVSNNMLNSMSSDLVVTTGTDYAGSNNKEYWLLDGQSNHYGYIWSDYVNGNGEVNTWGMRYRKGMRPVIRVKKNSKYIKTEIDQATFDKLTTTNSPEEEAYYDLVFDRAMNPDSSSVRFSDFTDMIKGSTLIPGIERTHIVNGGKHEACTEMVMQGVCKTPKYTLISAYCSREKNKHSSVLYVMKDGTDNDLWDSGTYVVTIVLKMNGKPLTCHVGGIAYGNNTIYIADSNKENMVNGNYRVWKLSEKQINKIIDNAEKNKIDAVEVNVSDYIPVTAVPSFVNVHGKYLYVGTFYDNDKYHYNPKKRTELRVCDIQTGDQVGNTIYLPTFTGQGVDIVEKKGITYFLISSSLGRNKPSELIVAELIDGNAALRNSIKMPNMGEDVFLDGNILYIGYESAAAKYKDTSDRTTNPKMIRPLDRVIKVDISEFVPESTRTTTIVMYRMYNPNSGEHFYTSSLKEKDILVKAGWKYEGVAWNAPSSSGIPVYRLYNPNAGDHHYTMSAAEKDSLVNAGWNYEGIGWYSDPNKGVPLYRLYNPNAVAGAHHYTTSEKERNSLVQAGWKDEGIAWYGVK